MPPNYKFPLRDGAASEFTPRAAAGKIASVVVNFSQRPSAMMSRGIPRFRRMQAQQYGSRSGERGTPVVCLRLRATARGARDSAA